LPEVLPRANSRALFERGRGELPSGTWFHASTACYPDGGRLRQLWSARHQGQVYSLSPCSGGLTPISKRRFGGSPERSAGTEALQSYGSRHHYAICGRLAYAITIKQIIGGWLRLVTAYGCDQSPATSTRGVHAARAGGFCPKLSAADHALGNSVGANESVVRCPLALPAVPLRLWTLRRSSA